MIHRTEYNWLNQLAFLGILDAASIIESIDYHCQHLFSILKLKRSEKVPNWKFHRIISKIVNCVSLTSCESTKDVKETTLAITIYRQLHAVRVVSLTSCQQTKDVKETTLAIRISRQLHGVRVVSLTSFQPTKDVKETTLAITIYRQLHGVRVVSLTSCRPKPSFEKNKFLKKCSQSFQNEAIV